MGLLELLGVLELLGKLGLEVVLAKSHMWFVLLESKFLELLNFTR